MLVRILDSAHNDIRDGYWFYENQEPGVGDYFIAPAIKGFDLHQGGTGSVPSVICGRDGARPSQWINPICCRFHSDTIDIEDGEARVYGVLDNRRDPNWIYHHLQESK